MKEEATNGVDFEMQELERMQLQRIKDKITTTYPNGWKFENTTLLTEQEKKIYFSDWGNSNKEDDYDRLKRGQEWSKFQQQRQIDKNNLNGTI